MQELILAHFLTTCNILYYKQLIYKLDKHSARKSFAQYAFDLGIPDSIIDYCLAHSDNGRGVVRYYTKTRFKQAEIAINRVAYYINNPSKYKEYIEMKADIMLMKI